MNQCLLSNFYYSFYTYRRVRIKPELTKSSKDRGLQVYLNDWLFTRFTWPRLVFVPSVSTNKQVVTEAMRAGFPTVGVIDTDNRSDLVLIPIPVMINQLIV